MSTRLKEWLLSAVILALLAAASPVHAFYNPNTGRWLSRDPNTESGFKLIAKLAENKGEHPFQVNAFVANNPVNRVDYLGLKAQSPDRPAILCQDPCKWAREHAKELDASTYGATVCCNGKKYGCVLKPGNNATDPTAKSIITDCIQAHEDTHVSDTLGKCHPQCGWTGPIWAVPDSIWEQYLAEFNGYSSEVTCLESQKYRCNGDAECERQVDAQIKNATGQADRFSYGHK